MKKFTIGLDARMIRHTGIGTYLRGLLSGLAEAEIRRMDLGLFGPPVCSGVPGIAGWVPFTQPIYSIQEQLTYPRLLKHCRLWHAPHYNIPFRKGKTRLVVTVHDLIHWVFRNEFFSPLQNCYSGTFLKRTVASADHIIAVSEHTRGDLIRFFAADPDRISVIPEAVRPGFQPAAAAAVEALRTRLGLPPAYFLYVGSLKPHKNVLWLVRLFRRLRREGLCRAKLVLAGRKDRRYPRGYEELGSLASDGDILHLPAVEDDDLAPLYTGAKALVHPSRYEGFGLTLLEAMACGTPVIACRTASIPEVTGESACLVDSCEDHGMMQAITRMERDPDLRAKLIEQGRQRVKVFSWEQTARATIAVYERVLSRP